MTDKEKIESKIYESQRDKKVWSTVDVEIAVNYATYQMWAPFRWYCKYKLLYYAMKLLNHRMEHERWRDK